MPILDIDRWATAFVECYREGTHSEADHPQAWANMQFIELIFDDPEPCWSAILAIMAKAPSAHALSMLAAGPLEDIVSIHGAEFIERVEERARIDPAFRQLLHGVWQNDSPGEIWDRVRAARGETR